MGNETNTAISYWKNETQEDLRATGFTALGLHIRTHAYQWKKHSRLRSSHTVGPGHGEPKGLG